MGCPSIGGVDPGARPAPRHGPESLPKEPAVSAAQIAFYKAVDGPGVFAPLGWHCQTWSGSNGSFIIVTPRVPPQTISREPATGRGVIAVESYGGTSGRFDVAEVSARLFPVVRRPPESWGCAMQRCRSLSGRGGLDTNVQSAHVNRR